MSNYRLLLVGEGDGRTGFVFCSGEAHARASAQALLELRPLAHAVEVTDDAGPVCRIERQPAQLVL